MKNRLCMAFMFVICAVFSAQAVVIHWSVDTYPSSGNVTSAQLVYVSDGTAPAYANGVISNGSEIGDEVSGLAITPNGIGEQNTEDSTRSSGAYYVVLFDSNTSKYTYGLTSLAYNDSDSITEDVYTPATSVYDASAGGFSSWEPVPEPGSAALLALGMVALALRRKKRG
jgi:hypothetical protein